MDKFLHRLLVSLVVVVVALVYWTGVGALTATSDPDGNRHRIVNQLTNPASLGDVQEDGAGIEIGLNDNQDKDELQADDDQDADGDSVHESESDDQNDDQEYEGTGHAFSSGGYEQEAEDD